MSQLPLRIRKARLSKDLSQAELARRLGVQRSSVSQWESSGGTLPNLNHLIKISLLTHTSFDWLATGRGSSRLSVEGESALVLDDYAMDADESKALAYLRSLTRSKKKIALQVLSVLAQ